MAKKKKKAGKNDDTVAAINKKFGAGTIMTATSDPIAADTTSTGSIGLDMALGCGGFPRGRIIEIYGPESSGKTTLALHAIAEAQKGGGIAAVVDAEHALDLVYAKRLGVDTEHLMISQPDYGEQALDVVEALVDSGGTDIIVVDSVAALTPKAEIEGDFGDATMGSHARLMSQACRKLTAKVKNANVILIFINQIRHKIGVTWGSPETTTGGNALKFYASVRVDVRRIGTIKDNGEPIGNRTRLKVVKNKMAPPFQECELDLIWGDGFDKALQLLEIGVDLDIIEKSGAWFSFDNNRLGQGRQRAAAALRESDDLMAEVLDLIGLETGE